ncbi:MAG: lipopolysaccharide core heptose(I) kinase RfaP, partial [Arenicellales bacterium]
LLLMVGSGFHTKGVDRALRAQASLPPGLRAATRMAVVGRGDTGRYLRLALQLGTAGNVVFTGGRDDVPELLRAADLLVHPSRQENTGTAILEALAAGLPVVATANCGYAHHVRDARAGVVLDTPFEQETLNQALWDLLSSPDRSLLAGNARRYGHDESLYRMPQVAVDLIESWHYEAAPLPFYGYVHRELADLSRRLHGLEDWLGLDGEVFRRARDRKTLRFEHRGRRYFLKAHFGAGWQEILKNLAQLKLPVLDAGNEWLAIHFLEMLGIPALTAVAYGRGPGLAGRRSFIVTRELEGMISLEDYAARPRTGARSEFHRRQRFIRTIAAMAAALHANGINHRDFYLCHFLFDPGAEHEVLHLIDLHRTQIRRRTPRRWRVKDIGGLYYSALSAALTRHERLRFVKAYGGGDSLRAALADGAFWSRVDRRARALKRAEDRRGSPDPSGATRHVI